MRTKLAFLTILLLAIISGLPINHTANAQQVTAEVTQTAAPTPIGVAVANNSGWTVQSIDSLPFAGGSAYLSPDGKHVVTVQGNQICLFTVPNQTSKCIRDQDLKMVIDPNSVVWSPDSQSIAFSDSFFTTFRKSYLWVVDIATMQPKNVTDDGKVEKFNLDPTKSANNPKIDIAPHWSADGKTLYFLRCEAPCAVSDTSPPAILYKIEMAGLASGQAQKVVALNQSVFVTYNFAITTDGQSLLYIVFGFDNGTNVTGGLWQMDLTTKVATQLDVRPMLFNVLLSADNTYALEYNPIVENQYANNQPLGHRLVNVSTMAVSMIDPTRDGYYPGWSPTGTAYAYLYSRLNPDRPGLYIVSKPGEAGQLVYNEPFLSAPTNSRGLQWSSDNTVMVIQHDPQAILLIHLSHQ